jgi:nucleotide-binding universal stress UspA family protein
MSKTILVPLDGSEVAAAILEQVVALARGYEAHLLLLTVGYPSPSTPSFPGQTPMIPIFQAEASLQRVRAYLETQGLTVSTMVCLGEPAYEILDVAERQNVDLIVINSRGGGGKPWPFLGSVAEAVTRTSARPVLVLHAQAAEGERA